MNENWKPWRTPWGQDVLVSEHFEADETPDGVFVYPEGDRRAAPSGHMPKIGYFFDSIIRQKEIDEDNLCVEDNLEEFSPMSAAEEAYWREQAEIYRGCDPIDMRPASRPRYLFQNGTSPASSRASSSTLSASAPKPAISCSSSSSADAMESYLTD